MPAARSIVSVAVLAVAAAAQTTTLTPLTDKKFTYPDLPYQVSPEQILRGPQFGFNICNSTTENQQSNCQTSFFNSIDDFCLWAPGTPNSLIADTEAAEVAWCSKKGHGTRVIPPGALQGVQFLKTPDYIQVTGFIDQTQINMQSADEGGELDPHGADEQGNPIGGLVFSNAWGGSNTTYTQAIEWTNFMGGNMFCYKACNPAGTNPAGYCQHIYDRIGCSYNAPAAYVNGTFEKCDSDSMELPGQYVSNGQTVTYYQPAESLGPITTVPYTPAIPKSSNCVQYQSNDLYAAAATSAAATASSGASSAAATGSAASSSHSGASSASRTSGASATSTSNASMRNAQGSTVPAMLVAGVVGFGGLLGVIAAL